MPVYTILTRDSSECRVGRSTDDNNKKKKVKKSHIPFSSSVEQLLFHGWLKSNFPQGGSVTYDPCNLYLALSKGTSTPREMTWAETKSQGQTEAIKKAATGEEKEILSEKPEEFPS